MKKYKYYLFDFDGTLVDSLDSLEDVYVKGFGAIGIKVTRDDLPYFISVSLREGFEKYCKDESKWPILKKVTFEEINKIECIKQIIIYHETKEALTKLKKEGAILGIVTGNTSVHVKDTFKYHGIDSNLFDVYIGNAECQNNKPKADPILMAIEKLKIKDKKDVVYIGDSPNDRLCAINAGIDYYLVDRLSRYNETNYPTIRNLLDLL